MWAKVARSFKEVYRTNQQHKLNLQKNAQHCFLSHCLRSLKLSISSTTLAVPLNAKASGGNVLMASKQEFACYIMLHHFTMYRAIFKCLFAQHTQNPSRKSSRS